MMTRISCSGSLISGFFCFVFASSADAIQPAAQKSPPHIDYDTVLAQHIAATMAQPEGRVLWRDTRFSHEQFALVSWQIPLAENLATGPLVTFQQDYHPLPLNSAVPQDISRVGWRLDYTWGMLRPWAQFSQTSPAPHTDPVAWQMGLDVSF